MTITPHEIRLMSRKIVYYHAAMNYNYRMFVDSPDWRRPSQAQQLAQQLIDP